MKVAMIKSTFETTDWVKKTGYENFVSVAHHNKEYINSSATHFMDVHYREDIC